ncbi:MAG: hypothetical protein JRH20_20165 [Deltaproteobacteria bacterium]|nr:hypothetical protein [Deltaproteobacteria bacterium]
MHRQALALLIILSGTPTWAAEPGTTSPRGRIKAKLSSLGKRLAFAVAPVRVDKTSEGHPKLIRWSYHDGKRIPKETIVSLPGGGMWKRILSYELGPWGEKRLRADTILRHPENTATTLRQVSLAENKVTHAEVDTKTGEATPTVETRTKDGLAKDGSQARKKISKEEKKERKERVLPEKLTMFGAYARAILASPVVHSGLTTGVFFLFWRYVPQMVNLDLSATQAMMAAVGTKALTLPMVAYHAFKEARLKTRKKKETP